MNVDDVIVLLLMAAADICLLAFLRRRRAYYIRMDRLSKSLQLHVRTEIASETSAPRRKKRLLQHAS